MIRGKIPLLYFVAVAAVGLVVSRASADSITLDSQTAIPSSGGSYTLDSSAATHSNSGWDISYVAHSAITPGQFYSQEPFTNDEGTIDGTPSFTYSNSDEDGMGELDPNTYTAQPSFLAGFNDAIPLTKGLPELITLWFGVTNSADCVLDVSLANDSAQAQQIDFNTSTELQFLVESDTNQDQFTFVSDDISNDNLGLWAGAGNTAAVAPVPLPRAAYSGASLLIGCACWWLLRHGRRSTKLIRI
jgi:hypothetical protein